MEKKKVILAVISTALLVLVLLGCDFSGDNEDEIDDETRPTVTDVTVNPDGATVARGQTQQFSATVAGTNNPAQTVTWTVNGGNDGTKIDANGLLTVAANETAEILTVTATSTVNRNRNGTAIVTVPGIGGSWSVTNVAEWNTAVNGIRSGGNNKAHTINVNGDISLPVSDGNIFGFVTAITVTLEGSGSLALSASGTLLQVGIGQTVIVRNLILRGRSDNDSPLIKINNGGIFRMEGSATVTGNNNSNYGNDGSGVFVDGGNFIMQENATVSDNTIGGWSSGGGVFVNSGTFLMQGNATVSGNTATNWYGGGGVYVASNGKFTMEGGTISGNTASSLSGGGVYVNGGNFTMEGGTVSYNTANNGGGAYVDNSGSFIMEGGTISSNIATNGNGGGVNVNSGTFTKTGGTIFGSGADTTLRNTSNQGDVAYINSNPVQWRNATAGPNDSTGNYGFWLNEIN